MNYKGMDANMRCRGVQYEVGKEYETDKAVACEIGFHACEYPLDVFNYYPPATSRYFSVEQGGVLSGLGGDTKVASTKIKILAEISIAELVKAAIGYIKKRTDEEPGGHATGNRGAASATGYHGAASATGERGAASATGFQSAAAATGDQSAASATGNHGAASATGYQSAAAATGTHGAASATGYQSAASATGFQGAASATGDLGTASATGNHGAASATGDYGAASATGRSGVALGAGFCCKAKGALGCAICVVERGAWDGETYPIIGIKAAVVDGTTIRADTYYTLHNGELVEA